MSDCETFDKFWDIFFPLKQKIDDFIEPCCLDGNCCKGDDCGFDCCNEDGNKEMGDCRCNVTDYEEAPEELQEAFDLASHNLTNHRDECILCIHNSKKPLYPTEAF